MKICSVTNPPGTWPESGKKFNVVLIRKGERYGLDACLVYGDEDPAVEFYDASCQGDPRFGEHGNFVARYNASTLLGRDKWSARAGTRVDGAGLNLMGGAPAWQVDAKPMDHLRWMLAQIVDGEILLPT